MKNHIKEKRTIYKMTQDELAELVDVSRQTIISIEKGRYNPSLLLAYQLAKIFECTIEELFDFEEGEA
ncbi:transcriptional regulator [Lysinibacillus alkalisoli]|uniref:Transcriptional regulator n=1 Tax=Lysinibacillus alkalisoli TaxID=1911548 RepID=A0A917LH55_9BACI|nr:helix-turn-helix transcriptional regulator [Lysinibacillus alkalisoli]GGG23092.1 transcriptional regulator [Lysinibacillus alkalisoli]